MGPTDDVGALLGHVDEVTSGPVRELDGVDGALRADDIGNVRDRRSARSAEVEDLLARADVNVVETAEDTGRELRAEGVPHAVLDLFGGEARVGGVGLLDRDALLAVDGLARDEVAGDEEVLLALGDKDARVPVGLEDDLGTALGADTTLAAASTATGRTTATGTATRCRGKAVVSRGRLGGRRSNRRLTGTTASATARRTAASTESTATSAGTTAGTESATTSAAWSSEYSRVEVGVIRVGAEGGVFRTGARKRIWEGGPAGRNVRKTSKTCVSMRRSGTL